MKGCIRGDEEIGKWKVGGMKGCIRGGEEIGKWKVGGMKGCISGARGITLQALISLVAQDFNSICFLVSSEDK